MFTLNSLISSHLISSLLISSLLISSLLISSLLISRNIRKNKQFTTLPIKCPYSLQDLLGRELSFKREMESLKDKLSRAEKEVAKVTAAARTHQGDKVRTRQLCFIIYVSCVF